MGPKNRPPRKLLDRTVHSTSDRHGDELAKLQMTLADAQVAEDGAGVTVECPTRSHDPGPSHCQAEVGSGGAGRTPDSDSARLLGTGRGPRTGGVGPGGRAQRLGPAPSGVADPCGSRRVDLGTDKDPPVESTLSQVRKSELLD